MSKRTISSYVAIAGTTAELLKLWPVFRNLGVKCKIELILTGQHEISIDLLKMVSKEQVEIHLIKKNQDIASSHCKTIYWMLSIFPKLVHFLLWRASRVDDSYGVIVHGDTLSTLFGALAGKATGHKVFHVEAGYRTNNWKNPFPEELIRRLVGRIADVHFCPTESEFRNIRRRNSMRVTTHGNTGLDSLELAINLPYNTNSAPIDVSTWLAQYKTFGIMTLHRFELLYGRNLDDEAGLASELRKIIDNIGLLIPTGVFERGRIEAIITRIGRPNILVCTKFDYLMFVQLLNRSDFVITDSGGLAQECNVLGKPCFIARDAVEDSTLRSNTAIIGTKFSNLASLVNNFHRFKMDSLLPLVPSPTDIVVSELMRHASR